MCKNVRWTRPKCGWSGERVVPAPVLAALAMLGIQLGAAFSTDFFTALSPAGTAWIRLAIAGLVLIVIVRPKPWRLDRSTRWHVVGLGVATAVMTMSFLEALARLPLGVLVAIEFLGPLGVAAWRSPNRAAMAWPALALVGVVALTEPWTGEANLAGIGFALLAGVGWGAYILLTQRVGGALPGAQGLAMAIPVGALVSAPFGAGAAVTGLTPGLLLGAVGLALLTPLVPFVLENMALRRMSVAAFGTLMAVEPGIAVLVGAVVLGQALAPWQIGGMVLVVAAGIGAEQHSRRAAPVGLAEGQLGPDGLAVRSGVAAPPPGHDVDHP
jgi:inner membrane transporter RhtA